MSINTKQTGDCGYVCFYNGKRIELYATSLSAAKDLAVAHFKPAKSKRHLISVTLAELPDSSPVIHTPAD